MTTHDVVKKIIGPVDPQGETTTDEKRYKNLKELISLTKSLIEDIQDVAKCANRPEFSMRQAGELAKKELNNILIEL